MTEPRFGQLRREPNLADRVAQSILERIVSGALRPGDRLPSERELGEQFGVSRTVVREAIRALSGRGVVAAKAGSGLRVSTIEPAAVSESLSLMMRGHETPDYRKVHEVRTMLEVHAAGAASERATEEDLEAMADAAEAMEHAKSVDEAARHDLEFHRIIARSTQNEFYLVLHDAIGDVLFKVRRDNLAHGSLPEALSSHRRILERIADRDGSGARAAMQAHLDAVEQFWIDRTDGDAP